ncbi:MAG: alcohol dehydrogenase, partial [Planctomycetota bacterium]
MNLFRLPTHVSIEPGCLARLPELVQQLGSQRVLLVTDEYLSQTDFCRGAQAAIEASGASCEVYSKVESNPRTSTVERIAELAREQNSQMLIGIGGGSVLDAAKAAAMLATNGGSLLDYVGKDRIAKEPLPFIAVPTTCGTGSEVTWVAVVTSEDAASKVSVKGLGMFPDFALVDAELIAKLPPPLLASTSMDALTHAIEASTGKCANPISDALSDQAVQRIFGYLERAVADSAGDPEARDHIACASTLAGVSFGNSDVGAVHCLSETLGGLFDVPHGLANAILLG